MAACLAAQKLTLVIDEVRQHLQRQSGSPWPAGSSVLEGDGPASDVSLQAPAGKDSRPESSTSFTPQQQQQQQQQKQKQRVSPASMGRASQAAEEGNQRHTLPVFPGAAEIVPAPAVSAATPAQQDVRQRMPPELSLLLDATEASAAGLVLDGSSAAPTSIMQVADM